MKKSFLLVLVLILILSVCGCGNHNKSFLPDAEDFLSVNTVTGLLNRYQSVACFEKMVNTADGVDKTRSWQYHQESAGGVAQRIDGEEAELYYNRFLMTTPDDGKTVSYGVYLNESDQPERIYFERENLFGQEDGAQIVLLDEQTETFRFTSTLTLNESNLETYRLWGAVAGDVVVGTHTVAKDDLRILRSETSLTHNGEEKLISVAGWTYLKPMQLHAFWETYKNDENRKLITVLYEDGTERRYFFPEGTTPSLYTDDGHQLFLDEEGAIPYVAEPITEPFTVYYK